jgi:hypothetical protein
MKGELISTQFNFEVKYEEDGVRKYLHLLPDTETSSLEIGMEVHFEKVVKLKENASYTSENGWDVNPVEGEYAKLTWVPTLYWMVENAIIRWSIDGTKTAGSLTREILELLKKDKI